MSEGSIALDRQEMDIVPLLGELIETTGSSALDTTEMLHGDQAALVFVDPTRIRQIFRNLLTNAAKWQTSQTWIIVDDDPLSNVVTISVLDDGPGVPADRVGDLFRRFDRFDPSQPGTGLGLHVSRTLARAHGGEIRYHRTTEGGSEFAVELPKAPELDRR